MESLQVADIALFRVLLRYSNELRGSMTKFIGLDGAQGSGKTTYSRKLLKSLQAQTKSPVLYIETDDFLTEREWREPLPESFFRVPANRRKLWDVERMGGILRELNSSANTQIQVEGLYNRQTGKRDRLIEFDIHSDSIVLVGGPFLLEPEFNELFDHLILLNVPEDVRRQRIVERNIANGSSKERALEVFQKFEHLYTPYWKNQLSKYDEVVDN
jgi:uridine kinase